MTGKGQVLRSSSILLNVFIRHLENRMECSLSQSGVDIKLGGVVNTRGTLAGWRIADRKFSKSKFHPLSRVE